MSTLATNTFQELATGDSVGAKYVVHGTAKAWANLDGTGTIALRDSLNVSSVVDNGAGIYRINMTNAMVSNNYALASSGHRDLGAGQVGLVAATVGSAAAFDFFAHNVSAGAILHNLFIDFLENLGVAYGDLA
jgi:hypothetical protein